MRDECSVFITCDLMQQRHFEHRVSDKYLTYRSQHGHANPFTCVHTATVGSHLPVIGQLSEAPGFGTTSVAVLGRTGGSTDRRDRLCVAANPSRFRHRGTWRQKRQQNTTPMKKHNYKERSFLRFKHVNKLTRWLNITHLALAFFKPVLMRAGEGPSPLSLSGFGSPGLLWVELGRCPELCSRATAWQQRIRIWWCNHTTVWVLAISVENHWRTVTNVKEIFKIQTQISVLQE